MRSINLALLMKGCRNFAPITSPCLKRIKYLAEEGAETLHFGRTDKENQGLRRFKLSWGATEEEIRYACFEMASGSWKRSRESRSIFHKRIFRALPASLNRLAGAIIYPHLD